MELEVLWGENQILIFFIGIFCILINESFNKKQKIIIVYIFTYLVKLFEIMDFKAIFILLNAVTFIYIGFLSNDEVKNNILCNVWDKIKDYLYKCNFEYSAIYFLISILVICDSVQRTIPILEAISINISFLNIKMNIISILLLGKAINNITSQEYETNTFQTIKNKMDKVAKWTELKKDNIDKEKLEMLIDIEDKSYFIRENSYNFLGLEFIKYKLNKNGVKIKNIKINKDKIKEISISKILKRSKNFIRGYGTIEMQIIRTLGVKHGYSQHVICRKIYEILYSKMFFKSLRKYMNQFYYDTEDCCNYKEYLLMVYIGIAPIKLNQKKYNNMLEPWNAKSIKEVNKEEFFISILGLSHRKISSEIFYNYHRIIEKYGLDENKLENLIDEFNNIKSTTFN